MLTDGACDGEAVYRAVTAQSPDAKVIVPPRSSAVARDTTGSTPSQRGRHIQMINERGRLGWQWIVPNVRRWSPRQCVPGLARALVTAFATSVQAALSGAKRPRRYAIRSAIWRSDRLSRKAGI